MLTDELNDLLNRETTRAPAHDLPRDDQTPSPYSDTGDTEEEIAALEDMLITGCGTGRRIHMLMDPDDWTNDEITEKIRDAYPEPTDDPIVLALEDEDPFIPQDPTIPETCEATRQTVPDLPPAYPSDIPDETEEAQVIAVATELQELIRLPDLPKIPDLPKKLTAALRRAASVLGKPPKDGTAKYWDLLAQAIAGIQNYLAGAGPSQEREGWAHLLNTIIAQLEAARHDPYAGLPPIPFFWPGLPPGYRVPPITPIYQAPPGESVGLPPGTYNPRPPAPKPTKHTTTITLNTPPPGLSDKDAAAWMKAYAWPRPQKA